MSSIKIPDVQILIAHQAFGSPLAPPSEQIGTWEGPNAVVVIFLLDLYDSP